MPKACCIMPCVQIIVCFSAAHMARKYVCDGDLMGCCNNNNNARNVNPVTQICYCSRFVEVPMQVVRGQGYTELNCCQDTLEVLQDISNTLKLSVPATTNNGCARKCGSTASGCGNAARNISTNCNGAAPQNSQRHCCCHRCGCCCERCCCQNRCCCNGGNNFANFFKGGCR